jgi:hypothetical protein
MNKRKAVEDIHEPNAKVSKETDEKIYKIQVCPCEFSGRYWEFKDDFYFEGLRGFQHCLDINLLSNGLLVRASSKSEIASKLKIPFVVETYIPTRLLICTKKGDITPCYYISNGNRYKLEIHHRGQRR